MADIINRRKMSPGRRKSEERLRVLMDNIAEAIIVIDVAGLITEFNNAAQDLFGYTSDETIGNNVRMLMPSPFHESHDGYMARYRETRVPNILGHRREVYGLHRDGSTIPIQISITEIESFDVFVGIILDLRKQKMLEKEIADISTQEQERIGRELHDGLGQQLTGMSMLANSLKTRLALRGIPEAELLDDLIGHIKDAIKDSRTLAHGLSPILATHEGLTDGLKLLARNVRLDTGIECSFVSGSLIDLRDGTAAMHIFRIAQEAVNNAVKHANAKMITISLSKEMLTVSDDGCGFELHETKTRGIGIRIMHYRASVVGARLYFQSSPGKGNTVSCKFDAV